MKRMELLLGDKLIQKILDARAFADFWRERYSKDNEIEKPSFPCSDKTWLHDALKRLDMKSQFILHLRYREDLTPTEIASFVKLQRKSICKIEYRALKDLHQMYFEDNKQLQAG